MPPLCTLPRPLHGVAPASAAPPPGCVMHAVLRIAHFSRVLSKRRITTQTLRSLAMDPASPRPNSLFSPSLPAHAAAKSPTFEAGRCAIEYGVERSRSVSRTALG